MTPTLNTIHQGDALTVLRTWPDAFVNCVVTSPPYWGLRDYGVAGQLGMEKSPDEYVARMVEIFREVKRVLRDDGSLWLNIGDTFCNAKGAAKNPGGRVGPGACFHSTHKEAGVVPLRRPNITEARGWGLKSGDLVGIPWRLAFALQADGWWIRMDNIWAKRNPMPESVNGWRWEKHRVKVGAAPREFKGHERPQGARDGVDGKAFASSAEWRDCPGCPTCSPNGGVVLRRGSWRCTKAHEYLFHLTKSATYYGDGVAAAEKSTLHVADWNADGTPKRPGFKRGEGAAKNPDPGKEPFRKIAAMRNRRSVWSLSSAPFGGAHFATFPPALVRPCILSSTPEKCCSVCGAPWARVAKSQRGTDGRADPGERLYDHRGRLGHQAKAPSGLMVQHDTIGWRPTCGCLSTETRPAVVLDPFMGAGTTACEAHWLKRDWLGIELKPEYIRLAIDRLRAAFPMERQFEKVTP